MPIPQFIELLKAQFEAEVQPFRKVHRLIDLSEAVIKYHTVVIVSDYMDQHEIHEEAKDMFGAGLKTPSLGIWQYFTENIYEYIDEDRAFWPEFRIYFKKTLRVPAKEIIELRNSYAHGATPNDETCNADIQKILPCVEAIINGGLVGRDIIKVKDGLVYIIRPDGRELCLDPLLCIRRTDKGEDKFFYYNDLRNKNFVHLLNYDEPEYFKDKDLLGEFYRRFPLQEWRLRFTYEFKDRIEALTDNFKGRVDDLAAIREFIRKRNSGQFMIWGVPGVGKSALVARVIQQLGGEQGVNDEEEATREIAVIEYFIRRGTSAVSFLINMNKRIEAIFKTDIPVGSALQDMADNWFGRLKAVSGKLNEGTKINKKRITKLVLFIDGLDEADDELMKMVPAEYYKNIIVFFASREVLRSQRFFLEQLDREKREALVIRGLGKDDIRSLLYDFVNKYEIEQDYVDAIALRSEGNPLYLKMLCSSLEEGVMALNDTNALPKGIYDFYYEMICRMDEKAFDLLCLLAVSLDCLPAAVAGEFLGTGPFDAERRIDQAGELLVEDPRDEGIPRYQLFHESLRDYMKERYAVELKKHENRIVDVCARWKELADFGNNPGALEYALKYHVRHLDRLTAVITAPERYDADRCRRSIVDLVLDDERRSLQVARLGFNDHTLADMAIAVNSMVRVTAGEQGEEIDAEAMAATGNIPVLCRVALAAGAAGWDAENDLSIAFEWARQGRIEDAVRRVSIIKDENRLFRALFLILWIVVDDGADLNPSDPGFNEIKQRCEYLLKEIDERIPLGLGTFCWGDNPLLPRRSNDSMLNICMPVVVGCYNYTGGAGPLVERMTDREKGILFGLIQKKHESLGEEELNIALDIASGINSSHSKRECLSSITIALVKIGKKEKALEVFESAPEIAINGDYEALFYFFRSQFKSHFESLYFLGLAAELSEAGDKVKSEEIFESALDAASSIDDVINKSYALVAIAAALVKAGEIEKAKEIFESALDAASSINDVINKTRALVDIAAVFGEVGEIEKAKEIFESAIEATSSIDDVINKSHALVAIAAALVKAGEIEKAKEAFGSALKAVSAIDDAINKSHALVDIAAVLGEAGEIEKAREVFESALKAASTIDDANKKSFALVDIAAVLGEVGEIEKAREVFESAIEVTQSSDEYFCNIEMLLSLAIALAEAGENVKAQNVFESAFSELSGITIQSKTFLDTVAVFVKTGDTVEAKKLCESAMERALEIDDPVDKSKTLSAIAVALVKAGDIVKAKEIFESALAVSLSIDDALLKRNTLPYIAVALVKAGEREKAIDTFKRILAGKSEGIDSLFEISRESALSIEFPSSKVKSFSVALVEAQDAEIAKEVFERALDAALRIYDVSDRNDALYSIVSAITVGPIHLSRKVEEFIASMQPLRYMILKEMTKAWVASLRDQDDLPRALVHIIRAIKWVPTDRETSSHAVFSLIPLLIRMNQWEIVENIALSCPQIGLPGIFTNSEVILPPEARAELAELDRQLAEEEITRKGYDKRRLEIFKKIPGLQ